MGSIGSVSVDVVPDATGFAEKLKAKLRDVKVQVKVDLDDTGVRAKLDELARNKTVKIRADVDTGAASAKLDELARTRTANVRTNVDKSSFSRAEAATAGLTSNLASIAGAAFAIGPALIPATAAVVGLAGALAAPIFTAGIGAGIFGAVAVGAIAKAKTDTDAIGKIRKKGVSYAQQAASYEAKAAAATGKQAAAYQKQADAYHKLAKTQTDTANRALNELPKSEQAFIKAKGTLKAGFADLLKNTDGAVFGTLAAGLALGAKVLPRLSPIVNAFGGAITQALGAVSKWTDSRGFSGFVNFIATRGTQAFKSFVGIAGNLAVGVGGLVKAFTPLGTSVLGGLSKFTAKFAEFGRTASSNKGFQSFIAYVRKVGPQVAHTLADLAGAVGKIVLALAPQGSTVLGILDGLAKAVSKLKPGQIAAIAGAVGALGLATGKFSKLTSLSLLMSAVSYAYSHSDAFHKLADGAIAFAGALNSLPSGIKIGLGAAAGGALLAGRLRGGAGGVVGKAIGGFVGKGVQNVFVTNPGFGGVGGGGLPGGVVKEGKPGLIRGALNKVLPAAAVLSAPEIAIIGGGIAAAVGGFILEKKLGETPAGRAAASTGTNGNAFRIPTAGPGSNLGPGANKGIAEFGNLAKAAIPQAQNFTVAAAAMDRQLVALSKSNPGKGLSTLRQVSQATGLSMKQLSTVLPGATSRLGATSAAAGKASAIFGKTGLTVAQISRQFRTLPKAVQTKLATPGAVKSVADVKALGKQFKLTPKQIATVMRISGVGKAKADADRVKKSLRDLNAYKASPTAKLVDKIRPIAKARQLDLQDLGRMRPTPKAKLTDNVGGTAKRLNGLLDILGGKRPKPKASITTSGIGPLTQANGLLNSLHSTSVTATITTRRLNFTSNIVRNTSGGTAPGGGVKRATGGSVWGPGTGTSDSIPAWLSNGEEVINARQATKHRALLKAINAGTRGFAAGGTAGGGSGGGSGVQRFVLDAGGGLVLTGHIDDRIAGHDTFNARISRQNR